MVSIDTAQAEIDAANADGKPFDVVMIAYAFAGTDHRPLFSTWCSRPDTIGVLIHPRRIEVDRTLVEFPLGSIVAVPFDVKHADQGLISQLSLFMGPAPRRPPLLENEADPTPNLRIQVQGIDSDLDFDRGRNILRQLVGLLTLPQVQSFSLYPLTQGGSGAKVFRIRHQDAADGNQIVERVLKLTPARDAWKA